MMPETSKAVPAHYYAKDRWPQWDFFRHPPSPSQMQKVVVKTETAEQPASSLSPLPLQPPQLQIA